MRFAPPLFTGREHGDAGTSRASQGLQIELLSNPNMPSGRSFPSPRKGQTAGKMDLTIGESVKKVTTGSQSGGIVPTLPISQMKDLREEKENVGYMSARSLKGQSDNKASERMVHSARSLSPQRRMKLQRMLEKEGVKEALSTLLQATSPRKKWDPALVEEQVERLLGVHSEQTACGRNLNPSPSRDRPTGEAQRGTGAREEPIIPTQESPLRARPAKDMRPATAGMSPSRRNLQEPGGDTKLGRPSTASEGGQRGQSEGGVKPEEGKNESSWDSAGGGSISPRKIPRPRPATAGGVTGEQRGDVPLMPTYTVAGKRMPLIQLLREKIWQRSPGGAHQLLKCFNQLDRDRSGAISPEEMRRFLATFHMDVDPHSLHAFLTALDANKDGNIDYDEFVQKLLPEDFPARGGMGRFGGGQESYLLSQLETARAMEKRRHTAVQQWQQRMSVDDLERLMREKLEGRVRGGPSHLRKAFRFVDQDGDGKLSPEELQLMLRTFNINTSPEEYASLLARYDPNNDGVIDYYEFVDKLMPPEFESKKQMAQRRAGKMQAESSRRLEQYEQAFSSAARTDGSQARPSSSDGSDAPVRLSLEDVRRACALNSLPLDDNAAHAMAATCRANEDGKLDVRQFLQQLKDASECAVQREMMRAPRDSMLGFSRDPANAPPCARKGEEDGALVSGKRPMTVSQVAVMFNEKVAARFHGRGPQENMRLAFAHFDVTGRGKLDHADVSRAFQNFNMQLAPGQKQDLLAKLDPAHTGLVTFAHFDAVLGTKPDLGFFPERRTAPFVPLQKNGRPFTATPRVTNVVLEAWDAAQGAPRAAAGGGSKGEESVASPRRLIMTPRSSLQSSQGPRPPTGFQSLAGRRPTTSSSSTTSSEDAAGQKGARPSTRSSTGSLHRSPYAAETASLLKKPSRHPDSSRGVNAPLPNMSSSRPSTAASAARPQNFDFGTLTPR